MTRILIVDDQDQNLYMLQVLLQGHGYEVLSARDGTEALDVARRQVPDLIITDILMPRMDGFSLCREWVADEKLKHVPLVFYTATYTDPKDEAFALSLGATRFIVKPAEPDTFVAVLQQVLEDYAVHRFPPPGKPIEEEGAYYQQYSQALVRKLEDKMVQLEAANRALESDIAQRIQAETELDHLTLQFREQARQMEQILVTVPAGVLLLAADYRIVMANPAAHKALDTLSDVREGDVLTRLGGRPLAELLTSPPIRGLWHEVKAGNSTFEVIARPVANGPSPESYVMVINDVTREREVRAELEQHERLATVGQLAAGIAHDFNNILAVIVLYAQMDLYAHDLPSRFRAHFQTIAQEAVQATNLVQQILDFGRRTVLEPHPLDLVPFLKERVKLLERTLPENIKIEFDYPQSEAVVKADPTRMQQMVTNLAVNARDAMPGGGDLRIELKRIQLQPHQPTPLHNMAAGPWIKIAISDTGTGIPAEMQSHLFEPFFTTKAPGKGSGLGLAQVYGIVKQHDGHIDVQTQVGQGTTFIIYLPAFDTTPRGDQHAALSPVVLGQGETILIVEDNAALREAMVGTLALLNYQALQAANGHEALAILEQQGADVALILSDLVMPELGGQALFYALRERGLHLPVVMMTGHPMGRELLALKAQGLAGWVLKPPSVDELAVMIARALRGEDMDGKVIVPE